MVRDINNSISINRRSAGYQQLLQLVDSVRTGRTPRPEGVFHLSGPSKAYALLIESSAFHLTSAAIRVLNLPEIPIMSPLGRDLTYVASLVLVRHAGGLALRLNYLRSRTPGYILDCPPPENPRLPPGIHNPAALQITKRMTPRTVSGGLPSLGKKR